MYQLLWDRDSIFLSAWSYLTTWVESLKKQKKKNNTTTNRIKENTLVPL